MAKKIEVHESSGNVFADLGFSASESLVLSVKADLYTAILNIVRTRGLTQSQLAKLWGKPQPRVSEILTGKLNLVSIDTLIGLVEALGAKVSVDIAA